MIKKINRGFVTRRREILIPKNIFDFFFPANQLDLLCMLNQCYSELVKHSELDRNSFHVKIIRRAQFPESGMWLFWLYDKLNMTHRKLNNKVQIQTRKRR